MVRLTEWTSCGGCAAKWGGAPLGALLSVLEGETDSSLLVGLAPFDDAAVYQVTPELATVTTTDFFPPLVDDPADFGAIAAANACSDVFAMGGRVVMALNIAAFPERLDPGVIATIVREASETVTAAGGTVAGGHTIRSEEPIFGLVVQGLVHPQRILTKGGAQPGDVLVLSKPIGTGIVLAAGSDDDRTATITGMRQLNRSASEALVAHGADVHAATDVTGFGLLGHAWEMAERGLVRLRLEAGHIPVYPGALEAAAAGVVTAGDERNRTYLGEHQVIEPAVSMAHRALAFDPQTSGGLLAAVDAGCVGALEQAGFIAIGEVTAGPSSVHLVA